MFSIDVGRCLTMLTMRVPVLMQVRQEVITDTGQPGRLSCDSVDVLYRCWQMFNHAHYACICPNTGWIGSYSRHWTVGLSCNSVDVQYRFWQMFKYAHYACICPHLFGSDQSTVLTASWGFLPSQPSEPSAPSAPRGSYTNSNELPSDAQFCSDRHILRNNAVQNTTLEGCGVENQLRALWYKYRLCCKVELGVSNAHSTYVT